jgi:hypothetical protein
MLGAAFAEIGFAKRSLDASSVFRLLHSAISGRFGRTGEDPAGCEREWTLLDTRNQAPNEFIVRTWVARDGHRTRMSEPSVRRGGILGLFTSSASSVSVGPVAGGVDNGVGLLLCGIASVLAIPLPSRSAVRLDANWLCVMSRSPSDFRSDAEIERLMLLTWVILLGPLVPDESHEHRPSARRYSRAFGQFEPAAIPMAG